jgi:hypothetical protein
MTIPDNAKLFLKFLTEDHLSAHCEDYTSCVYHVGETIFCPFLEDSTTYGRFEGLRAWDIYEDTARMQWAYMTFTPRMVLVYAEPDDILSSRKAREGARITKMTVVRELSHDEVREWLPQQPEIAVKYALKVDCGPHDATRNIAMLDGRSSLKYAIEVDKAPRDDTRKIACLDPFWAVKYASDVDKQPRDDTRAAAILSSKGAYAYASDVDRCSRDDTRKSALRDIDTAYHYALYVDEGPEDDTRLAVCKDPTWAYMYAKEIDKSAHPVTWAAVKGRSRWEPMYTDLFGEQNVHFPMTEG